ncbi:hypothetical protein K8I85_09865, partial [bacterium]|nr:hypothetical protein [bacterium]
MRRSTLLVVVAALVVTVPATADLIVPQNQSRYLNSNSWASDASGFFDDAESNSAPDMGPFQDAVAATNFLDAATGLGVASLDSEILASSVHAEGTHAANADAWDNGASAHGSAASHCEWTFVLTEDADYQLTGFLEEYDSGITYLLLDGPGGNVLSLDPIHNVSTPVNEAGSLPAGEYTLKIHSAGSVFAGAFTFDYSSGAYDVDLLFATATGANALAGDGRIAASPNPFRDATVISWSRGVEAVTGVQ